MASPNPRKSLYPEVIQSNPDANSPFLSNPNHSSSSSSLYPKVDMNEVAEKLFPDHEDDVVLQQNPSSQSQPTSFKSSEEVLIRIPGAIVHLIDKQQSVELANGELTIVGLRQGDNVVAVLCRVGDEIQWPLARDEAAVKLDESHYFFTLHVPSETKSDDENESENTNSDSENLLNYGLTIASKGQKEGLLKELDGILENYSAFSVQKVSEAVDGSVVAKEISPEEMKSEAGKELMEDSSAAYWTTLAPNVEDYSSTAARLIAGGSQQLIKGILWCGDVTVDSMKWGHEFLKMRVGRGSNSQISPQAMRRVKRVKNMTKRSEKVASGILSGVVKVSGFFTSSVVNSKVGNKFFSLLPGEIILASLDGFNKVCDAVEVAGRNVMSTTSVVTTGLVSHRYGEQAGKVTNDGLDAAGYAMGTAWAVFKIRKALNPKRAVKPTTFAKAAAQASYAALKAKK